MTHFLISHSFLNIVITQSIRQAPLYHYHNYYNNLYNSYDAVDSPVHKSHRSKHT